MGGLLLDVTIKGTLALLATGVAVAFLRGGSAATRHAIWTVGMGSALALPVLSRILPGWSLAMIPADAPAQPMAAAAVGGGAVDWGRWLVIAWAAGVAIVMASVVLGRVRVWWIARGSTALDHGEIPALLTALCGEMRIARPVCVRLCPDRVMPMVWGVTRPVVLLPAEAASWTPELRRDVLLHELAHVRRYDYLNQIVVRLACAVHWFNPLVWVAARRLRTERERACDDHVLETGASACDYAEHLVAVARRLRPAGRGTLGVAMAGRSAFGERVAALLDAGRARGILTGGLLVRSGLGAACLVVPLAALHPDARPAGGLDEPPPAQLIGPPPSANARAAGALPEMTPKPSNEKAGEQERPARADAARPSAPPASTPTRRASTSRDGVLIVEAPAIRVVLETVGSAPDWSPGTKAAASGVIAQPTPGKTDSSECAESKTPAAQPAAPGQDPELVWIPAVVSTP